MRSELNSIGLKYKVDRASSGHNVLYHYERSFQLFRNRDFIIFEIGIPNISKYNVWKEYFPFAKVVFIYNKDIAEEMYVNDFLIEIGDVNSYKFFDSVVSKHGNPLIIIDDGSHRWDHQRVALESLLIYLESGGIYIVEALHTSYELGFSGREAAPFVDYLKDRIDFLHLRGVMRDDCEKKYSLRTSDVAKQIEYVEFIPRACIIHKKLDYNKKVSMEKIPISVNIVNESKFFNQNNSKIIHDNGPVKIYIPRCVGSVSRAQSSMEIDVPPSVLSRLSDVVCLPRQILIKDGQLLPDSFRRRRASDNHVYLRHKSIDEMEFDYPHLYIDNVIREPCFYLDGEHVDHFGHFTLEVLSRLWPFEFVDLSAYKIITSAKKNARIYDLLKPFGVKEEQIYYFNRPIRCLDLTIASQDYILERSISDVSLGVWRHISEYYHSDSSFQKLYISRSRWKKQRYLNQEEEIESRLRENGFHIFHPEDYDISQQISIVSNAMFVAGTSGSGFYNCIYNYKKGRRVILAPERFITMNDALINRQSDSDISYISGKSIGSAIPMLDGWDIDPDLAVEGILSMLT